jgi:hypothetical protein
MASLKSHKKTPKKEIEKAERIRLEYLENQLNKINYEIL